MTEGGGRWGGRLGWGGLPCCLTTAFCYGGLKPSRAHLQLTKGISVGSQLLPRPGAGLCRFVSACCGGKVTNGTLLNCPGSHSFLFFSAPLLLPTFLFKPPKAKVIPVKTPFGSWPLPEDVISSEPGFYWRPKNSPEQQIKAESQCGLLDAALLRMAVKRAFGSLTWCIECSH